MFDYAKLIAARDRKLRADFKVKQIRDELTRWKNEQSAARGALEDAEREEREYLAACRAN